MDLESVIAGAVANGAAAAMKSVATRAVKDTYAGLITLIKNTYKAHAHVADAVEHLAKTPEDKHRRAALAEELKASIPEEKSTHDIVAAASALMIAIENEAPDSSLAIGLNIGELKAAALRFERVNAPGYGIGVKIEEANIEGTASFKGIGGASPPKK